jgi:hypothetical protein
MGIRGINLLLTEESGGDVENPPLHFAGGFDEGCLATLKKQELVDIGHVVSLLSLSGDLVHFRRRVDS